jgi:hypothetical protein
MTGLFEVGEHATAVVEAHLNWSIKSTLSGPKIMYAMRGRICALAGLGRQTMRQWLSWPPTIAMLCSKTTAKRKQKSLTYNLALH